MAKYGIFEAPPEILKELGLSKAKINFEDIIKEKKYKEGGKEYSDIYK